MPVSNNIRGGFLLDHINFLSDVLRLDQLMANFFASQVISDFKFDLIDLHYMFRNRIHHRKDDGIHWDDTTHREITNILVSHICKAWDVKIPDRCRFDRGLTKSYNSAVSLESFERKSPDGQENRDSRISSVSSYSYRYKPYWGIELWVETGILLGRIRYAQRWFVALVLNYSVLISLCFFSFVNSLRTG